MSKEKEENKLAGRKAIILVTDNHADISSKEVLSKMILPLKEKGLATLALEVNGFNKYGTSKHLDVRKNYTDSHRSYIDDLGVKPEDSTESIKNKMTYNIWKAISHANRENITTFEMFSIYQKFYAYEAETALYSNANKNGYKLISIDRVGESYGRRLGYQEAFSKMMTEDPSSPTSINYKREQVMAEQIMPGSIVHVGLSHIDGLIKKIKEIKEQNEIIVIDIQSDKTRAHIKQLEKYKKYLKYQNQFTHYNETAKRFGIPVIRLYVSDIASPDFNIITSKQAIIGLKAIDSVLGISNILDNDVVFSDPSLLETHLGTAANPGNRFASGSTNESLGIITTVFPPAFAGYVTASLVNKSLFVQAFTAVATALTVAAAAHIITGFSPFTHTCMFSSLAGSGLGYAHAEMFRHQEDKKQR